MEKEPTSTLPDLKQKTWQSTIERLGAEGKMKAVSSLYYLARALKEAKLREVHPEWDDLEIKTALNEWMWYARD